MSKATLKSTLRICRTRAFAEILAGTTASLILLGSSLNASARPFTVAVSLDIPPYVMNHASRGVEVYLLHFEVANQAEQVRKFWEAKGKVIVIDRNIFDYFSKQQGHSLEKVEYHPLFPKVTKFKAAFADAAIRNQFNARLKQLCESGEYQRILKLYHVADLAGVCDGLKNSELSQPHPKP